MPYLLSRKYICCRKQQQHPALLLSDKIGLILVQYAKLPNLFKEIVMHPTKTTPVNITEIRILLIMEHQQYNVLAYKETEKHMIQSTVS